VRVFDGQGFAEVEKWRNYTQFSI